ncbi:MAG: gliding motility-associated C-terminal domain-containing protein, partial [Pedobacter sp.]
LSDDGNTANGDDNCTVTPLSQASSIAIVKTGVFDDLNGDGYAEVGEHINYTFTVTNTGDTVLSDIVVTDNELPIEWTSVQTIATLGVAEQFIVTGYYVLTQDDIDAGKVTNQAGVKAFDPDGFPVDDVSDGSDVAGNNPTVTILPVDNCTITVYNMVFIGGMPNAATDMNYEHLQIAGIVCFPDNTVEIYNRWGIKVFETKGYNNNDKAFRGYSDGRVTVNNSAALPEGTYYYILKYKDGNNTREKAGFLHLTR